MSTLTQPDWKWYVGHYEETFTSGPYDTRDEAVQIARDEYEGAWIIEAYKRPLKLSSFFDEDRFLEDAEEDCSDLGNEDGDAIFYVTDAQAHDLVTRVRATIDQWQLDHGLVFMPWIFTGQRNLEFINGEMGDPGQQGSEADQGAA